MKYFKNILLLLLSLFVIGAVYLATIDGSYDVARTRSVEADPLIVFNDLNDYRNWSEWGPWYEQDSTIRVQYNDKTVGVGGAYSWTSDIEGGGRMKTLKTKKSERLDQEIIFESPFGDMRSEVYWILDKTEEGTDLTWGITGELPFFSRFMASGIKDQLGPMEERGLELFDENLQRKLRIYSIDSVGIVDFSGGFYLYTTASSRINDMNDKLRGIMERMSKYVTEHNIRLTGGPFAIYHKFDMENGTAMFSVAYPIAERIMTQDVDILTGYMERGTYFKTVLKGSYNNLKEAWDRASYNASNVEGYIKSQKGEPFEIYVKSPDNTVNPAELLTEIYIPVEIRN